ncbi:ABC transporter ATP-binding protein [Streptomyces zagrosensis]|uniref:ATP-binding cassette subfamily B protein n=1 Tax=Streptomyces zagrosensis TaxID=1042984 RepID=A0A7W9UWE7_9ACTN|nr:ABC transporter ATP-binding protein [Streptomyces zagrosensis]MBB5933241.1 ATP-binding cassette subfamily B protein [Streptomyces zagrosensis]
MASATDRPTGPDPDQRPAREPGHASASARDAKSGAGRKPKPSRDPKSGAGREPDSDPRTVRLADRLLRDALRHHAGRAAVLCLLSTAAAGVGLALPATIGHTIDLLLADDGGAAAGRWVAGCAALTALLIALDTLCGLLTGTTNARATAWVRRHTLRHALALGPRPDGLAHGDLVSRLVGNAVHAGTAPTTLAATAAAVITPIGGLIALALIDPWLALAFLVGLPVLGTLLRSFVRDTTDSVARYQHSQGEIAGRLVETLHGARTVAAAGTAVRERERILAGLPELGRHGFHMWRVQGRSTAQTAAVLPLLQIAVLAVAGMRLTAGELSIGSLLAASRYATLATGFGMLVGRINSLVRSRSAARRLARILGQRPMAYGNEDLPPALRAPDPATGPATCPATGPAANLAKGRATIHQPAGPAGPAGPAEPAGPAGPSQPQPLRGALELRGVGVSRGERPVLREVWLRVPAGQAVAVVGRSGAGKSLLAALAGRLADPDEGQVLLDGVPLTALSHEALRREVGYAFERPALLGGTIGGTIAFGGVAPSPDRVTAAARAACADDFIRLLPDGYATPCAYAPLSGGEAQRLGLARAFAHQGRLLVLDDATSSLDTVTELRVSEALTRQRRSRTCLIVAHRVATAARADQVAWLDAGTIRALAPHHELWQHPDYRAVFSTPADNACTTDNACTAEDACTAEEACNADTTSPAGSGAVPQAVPDPAVNAKGTTHG